MQLDYTISLYFMYFESTNIRNGLGTLKWLIKQHKSKSKICVYTANESKNILERVFANQMSLRISSRVPVFDVRASATIKYSYQLIDFHFRVAIHHLASLTRRAGFTRATSTRTPRSLSSLHSGKKRIHGTVLTRSSATYYTHTQNHLPHPQHPTA